MKQSQKQTQNNQVNKFKTEEQVKDVQSKGLNKNVLDEKLLSEEEIQEKIIYEKSFKQYENYRSYLLQYQFLNQQLKSKMNQQTLKLEIEFTDRLQQLRDIIEENINLEIKILRERAINSLENILAVEYKNYKEIFSRLDEFSDYSNNLQEFLNGTVKKVYIDSGLSIDIQSVNSYITQSSQIIEKIISKHTDFFADYPLIAQALSEIIHEITIQIRAIKSIQTFLNDIHSDQIHKIDDQVRQQFIMQPQKQNISDLKNDSDIHSEQQESDQ